MLLLPGCTPDGRTDHLLSDLTERFQQQPSLREAAEMAFHPHEADQRRRGIGHLARSDEGGQRLYVRMYRLLADDEDPTVRSAAARALGEHGQVRDAATLVALLEDEAAVARWEAARALQRIHTPEAVGPLLRVLRDDDDADVRLAAAQALGQYPESRVFHGLVGGLHDRNAGVVQTSRRSLRTLTGQDFGFASRDWLSWADENAGSLFEQGHRYTYQNFRQLPSRFRPFGRTHPLETGEPVGYEQDG